MGKITKGIAIVTLFFLSTVSLIAQDAKKEQTLDVIIKNLQKQHNVQFNYAEDVIKSITLKPPPKNSSLKQALVYLEKTTPLQFSLNNSSIVIVKPKEDFFLCGYLKDKDNLQPIVSATVQGFKDVAITDVNGYFKIKISKPSELITIRYLGYKTINRVYNQFLTSECGSVFMLPDFQFLSEVLISNYITAGINKFNDGSFKVDFKNFDILPGLIENDVLQAVQSFPGIQSIDETVSNLNIRGGAHDQNLILWDNIKMYQSGHFFGLISMFNPQITQQVSILKNGSDVSYTDGVSGTISMQTDKNINNVFKANVGVNLTDVNLFVDLPTGKMGSLQVAGRKSVSEVLNTPTYNNYFERISQNTEVDNNVDNTINSDKTFDFYDASLRWLYKISENDEIRLNFITVSNQLQFDETAEINNTQQSRTSQLNQNSIAGGLYYKRTWSTKVKSTFEVYETDYKLKSVNANVLESQRFLQENIVSETSLKLQTQYSLNNTMKLSGGYHFVETEITNLDDVDTPVFRILISEVLRTHGAFAQVNYSTLNKNTTLVLGVRYNYLDKFKKQIWEPRFNFSQRFLDYFTVEILGEFKHQNTSQIINFQNDFLGIEKRRWQLSNNMDIPVITSQQLSLGVNYSKNEWLVSVDGYYKNVDGITAQSQGFQNQYEFVKSKGSYSVTGLDLLLRKQFSHFNTWLSYSLMNNLYEFKDLEDGTFPSNFNITHAANFGLSYSNNNFKSSIGANWHTGKPITIPEGINPNSEQSIIFGETNAEKLEDYIRVDASVQYDFKISNKVKAKAGVSIWNILNKENQVNTFYRIKNNEINQSVQQSLGITPNATIRLYF
ncbi:TonB-dependent receptor plug domain-containing protein [Olleya aquimaris]|uniref:Outer membrane receptor for ferrienterochelin and colicin n=1 Tax=Olleya aquimaris TaxID=639310 RepID=A0A327RLH4_9FLAO|nr:TonB-dependent receptor plug domain-containing protein [Olleya aquimaris]RAJ17055.1 outer membrane receptor for ferrienterochelin and colicin [Olleya aquimaris]